MALKEESTSTYTYHKGSYTFLHPIQLFLVWDMIMILLISKESLVRN